MFNSPWLPPTRVSYLPPRPWQACRFTGVVFVPIQEPIPKATLGVAWRTTDSSKPLHFFLKTLVQVVQASTSHMEYLRLPAAVMDGQQSRI